MQLHSPLSMLYTCTYKWVSATWRPCLGLEAKTAVQNNITMKINCCIDVKVDFENVRVWVHVHVRVTFSNYPTVWAVHDCLFY